MPKHTINCKESHECVERVMKQVELLERAFHLPPRLLLDNAKLAVALKLIEKPIKTRKDKLKMENKFNVDKLLESRARLRGDFSTFARTHVAIIEAIEDCATRELSHEERVALTMITHKIARVITAQSYDEDSWQDIAGYATLVVNKFKENQNERMNVIDGKEAQPGQTLS